MRNVLKITALLGMLGIGLFLVFAIYANSDSIFWGWTTSNIENSKKTGDILISKLNLFHEQHGRYPRYLSELIPDYIDTLPLPSAGEKKWNYHEEAGGGFGLSFSMPRNSTWNGYPSCFYSSSSGRWYLDN